MPDPAASPPARIRLAVTVDDLFQWRGVPSFRNYDFRSIAGHLTSAFEAHAIPGVYAFSNTAPTDGTSDLPHVFDHWAAASHHVGNHTHHHASLNWLTPQRYIADIEQTEALIAPWSSRAPTRYFRHCFDMWGDTREKRDDVVAWLGRAGFEIAPITLWFYDAQFAIAYLRAMQAEDVEARRLLRTLFVETAVQQLKAQAAAARLIFGRDPVHIWLIHGTAIAADCLHAILDGFAAAGVEFVQLEEAMQDPMNRRQPLVTPLFRNQVQKWAEAHDIPIEDCPPAILDELDKICPIPGMNGQDVFAGLITGIADSMGVSADLANFSVA